MPPPLIYIEPRGGSKPPPYMHTIDFVRRGDSRIARRFRPLWATNVTAAGGGKREHLWAKRSILFGAPSRKQNRVPREGKAVKFAAFDWGRETSRYFLSPSGFQEMRENLYNLPPSRALRVPPPSQREE